MKRFFAILLILVTVLSLCACDTDHSLKFIGTWEDELGNNVLILREDGNAEFNSYEVLEWVATGYDVIELYAKEEAALPGQNTVVPETTEAVDATGAAEATEATEAEEATEATVAATEAATEATEAATAEGTEPAATEGTEAVEAPTAEAAPETTVAQREPVAVGKLSIKDGKMLLAITFKDGREIVIDRHLIKIS